MSISIRLCNPLGSYEMQCHKKSILIIILSCFIFNLCIIYLFFNFHLHVFFYSSILLTFSFDDWLDCLVSVSVFGTITHPVFICQIDNKLYYIPTICGRRKGKRVWPIYRKPCHWQFSLEHVLEFCCIQRDEAIPVDTLFESTDVWGA